MPAISIDGMSLVYSRRFVKDDVLQEDFFVSKQDSNNLWLPSKLFGSHLNTNGNEGAFSFSIDNNRAVFTSCDRDDRLGSCDLYFLINGRTFNAGRVINSKEWLLCIVP